MNTPLQASTFCSLHKPREMKVGSESSICGQVRGTHLQVLESILQQKQTRNGSYYQVINLLAVCVDGDKAAFMWMVFLTNLIYSLSTYSVCHCTCKCVHLHTCPWGCKKHGDQTRMRNYNLYHGVIGASQSEPHT